MANIAPYIEQIQNAVYGEEVRSSIINAITKVNDDNDSYQDLKDDIIDAKDDVEAAVAEYEQAITDGNTAKTNLETATTAANTAKTNLETATTAANTAKTNAETAKSNLDSSISNSTTAKSNLDSSISTAGTTNTTLTGTISSAGTAKTNLETAISDAGTANTTLTGTISSAGTAQSNLETATTNGNTKLGQLTAMNATAVSNLEQLRSENFNAQEILTGVTDLRAYLGVPGNENILGLQVDYENKTFTRLAGAEDLTAGTDFDDFDMYGGRRRCIVDDSGNIVAYYGDVAYVEDGSLGQVMVYQPKFYYLVCPVRWEKISTGIGYHLRCANYYVSDELLPGFRLHPAFYDANGNEVDYILMGAYEGSLYDASEETYITDDSQVMDTSADKFCSIAGVRPTSGITQNLTRPNVELLCRNRGTGWHMENAKVACMEMLLCMIEMGTMNFQTAIGQGVVSMTDNSSYNCASFTGATASLGNATGQATSTTDYTGATQTTAGKLSISYRGRENDWGNIWKFEYGINIWGNGSMGGGQAYVCTDFNYAESKNSDNYEAAGFTIANANGYISAMGYGNPAYDWLFIASETLGNSSLPVGDYTYVTANLNAYRIALLGGRWSNGAYAGGFSWTVGTGVGNRSRGIGGRLVYIPTAA